MEIIIDYNAQCNGSNFIHPKIIQIAITFYGGGGGGGFSGILAHT